MAALEGLSRRHGFKISTTFPCSVEDCRKQTSETCGSKAKKTADGEEKEVQTESSGEETESSEEEEEMPTEAPEIYLRRRPLATPFILVGEEDCFLCAGNAPVVSFDRGLG
ncbi:unnamed protein product [Boreogadus saida]